MNIVFALELPTSSAIEQAAQWLANNSKSNGFMLVDSALLDISMLDRIIGRSGLGAESAYANSPISGFSEYAPRLFELNGKEEAAIKMMRSLLSERSGVAALSLITARYGQTMRQIQEICSFLARVAVNDNSRPLHMRMADTRVINNLFEVLSPSQMDVVAAKIHQWGWFGRDGQWQSRTLQGSGKNSENISLQAPMRLTGSQFRELQRLSEADRFFAIIDKRFPELFPDKNFAEFHAKLQGLLDAANRYQVHHPDDRLQFVVLGLKCGENFYLHPRLDTTWQAVVRGERLLFQMRHWDDELWADLEGG
ncbi:hypothetical protein CO611_09170 [Lysobacteraceae bacterium NML03-0222]|nr:hypothetical protein CO611_09170 [Xanthomonadaceae bacterium NML03-0222]